MTCLLGTVSVDVMTLVGSQYRRYGCWGMSVSVVWFLGSVSVDVAVFGVSRCRGYGLLEQSVSKFWFLGSADIEAMVLGSVGVDVMAVRLCCYCNYGCSSQ